MVFDSCQRKDFGNLDVLTFGTRTLAKLSDRDPCVQSSQVPLALKPSALIAFSSLDHCDFVKFKVTSAEEVLRSGTC